MATKFEEGPISAELIPVAKGSRIGYQRDEKEDENDLSRSDSAVSAAMELIYRAAKRVNETLGALADDNPPAKIEVDFALKLDENGKASIAHSGSAAHFHVKLIWKNKEDD